MDRLLRTAIQTDAQYGTTSALHQLIDNVYDNTELDTFLKAIETVLYDIRLQPREKCMALEALKLVGVRHHKPIFDILSGRTTLTRRLTHLADAAMQCNDIETMV